MINASVVSTKTVQEAIVVGYGVVLYGGGTAIVGKDGFRPLHITHCTTHYSLLIYSVSYLFFTGISIDITIDSGFFIVCISVLI